MATSNDKQPIISAEKLNVIYFKGKQNQVNAVSDADLEIYPGEFVVFFGPSGCGKSTLLYSIAGLERNIEGNIFIKGKNLSKIKNHELDLHRQKTIGMIFQAYHLINSLTVLSNVILPQFSTKGKAKDREKRALELLDFFGVKKQAEKFPNELSGGQQQRVAICRSLMNDPEIILADEPTGNLDSKSAIDVMNLLLDLNEKQKKTVILVTHSPGSLDYASKVFYMKDGRITDVKVNRRPGEKIDRSRLPQNVLDRDLESEKKLSRPVAVSRDLDLPEISLLADWKAKNLLAEVLFGFSIDEIINLERLVSRTITLHDNHSRKDFFEYLDKDIYQGGLGLDKRFAKKLAKKFEAIISESARVKDMRLDFAKREFSADDKSVLEVRSHLLAYFDVGISKRQALLNLDQVIFYRLRGDIDFKEVRATLDSSVKSGGVGLDKRVASKMSKYLELLILSSR